MAVTPASVHKVLDTLWINKVEGLPAPAWLNYSGPDWQRLVTVGSFQWNEYSWTPDLVRFGSGRLLDEILGTMDNISHGRLPDRGARLRLYSDHDTTVASALAALGNTEFVWPDFASAVLFELHSDSGQFSLKFFFSNGTGSQRQLFTLPPPGCPKPGQPCPLASALAGLAPMRLSLPELIKRCRVEGGDGILGGLSSRVQLLLAGGLLLLTCAMLAFVGACRWFRRRERQSGAVYNSLNTEVDG
ncbi:hypothetical protein BOX15_Mlig003826g2 [Macrostomum lignano]|uniref:2-phosphoxylose phosphatase 1 n=1 Tax=Macrostomum lignano TaxID=282301 RepID=A0A267G4P8_9PLAT|nr:hypothetical protein BOX15_Mlig003826g2 [Macrostomum lignano]